MTFRLTEPKTRMSEADVIADCTQVLNKRGYWLHRNPVGMFRTLSGNPVEFGPVGIPDYTAIHGTYPAFFIEFKRPGKVLRPSQREKFSKIQFGFRLNAVMVDSVEQLIEWLSGHEKKTLRNAPEIERSSGAFR